MNTTHTRAGASAALEAAAAIAVASSFQLTSGAGVAQATPALDHDSLLGCAAALATGAAGIVERSPATIGAGGLGALDQCFDGPSSDKSSFAGRVEVPRGRVANVYSRPDTRSEIVGTMSNGATVEITCTIQGSPVSNKSNGKTASLWDKTDSGYVADVDVETGTDQPTMPNC